MPFAKPIISADNLVELVGKLSKLAAKNSETFIVTDGNVGRIYSKLLSEIVPPERIITIPAGEESKSFDTVSQIIIRLLDADATRDTLLIAFGGGVVTDIAGFTAAVYKRGVRFVNVPTSLLAMVDAAIGGKNGVDIVTDGPDGRTVRYKNMAGTFKNPDYIIQCQELLETLPESEMKNGEAEMLKTFIIGDAAAYKEAVELFARPSADNPLYYGNLSALVNHAAEIKYEIAEFDFLDTKNRQTLNLGHTFGHAIEELYGCSHGAAVAQGLIIATRLGLKMGLTSKKTCTILERDLKTIGLVPQSFDPEAVMENKEILTLLRNDKKCHEGHINFVFIRSIGNVKVKSIVIDSI